MIDGLERESRDIDLIDDHREYAVELGTKWSVGNL